MDRIIKKTNRWQRTELLRNGTKSSDGNLLLVGNKHENAWISKFDAQGTRIWDREYKIGEGEGLGDHITDCVEIPKTGEIVAVGISPKADATAPKSKFPPAMGEDFIVRIDADGKIVAKEIFQGSPWPGSEPQLCRLNSGRLVVLFGKITTINESSQWDVRMRMYGPDLKPIANKEEEDEEVIAAPNAQHPTPPSGQIVKVAKGGFVTATTTSLYTTKVVQYDEEGQPLATLMFDMYHLGNIKAMISGNQLFIAAAGSFSLEALKTQDRNPPYKIVITAIELQ